MPRTFYTIDDLYQFCKTNQFERFSSKQYGNKPLIVQSIETFESADNSKDGLLPVKLKACHIGANRNKSSISEDSMKKYMSSFKGRPILGAIYKTDTGEYEFHAHDMAITEDGVEYIEQPIGVISEINEPYLQYDENEDKTYLMVSGNVFEDYSKAAEILKRRKTCKCSVEIAVDELSWDGKEEVLSIDVFSFRGVTILGYEQDGVTEVEEGMKGSKITIDNFSAEQNSMFSIDYQEKLLETLDKLNLTLSKFSIEDTTKKGVENEDMNHFEELLEKYGITEEDIDFEVEGLSDEELDVAFEEHFAGCKKKKKCEVSDGNENEDESDSNDDEFAGCKKKKKCETESDEDIEGDEKVNNNDVDDPEEDFAGCKKKRKCSLDEQGNVSIEYELSHDDIRAGLYTLLREESDDDYFWPWVVEVYDTKFIYEDEWTGKFYRRNYIKDGDNVAFNGEAVEVFSEWLSQDEKDALDALKQSYAELKQFKDSVDAAEIEAKKDAIFNRDEYSVLVEDANFIDLKKNANKFSVEEVESKVKAIFADYVIAKGQFALNGKEKRPMGKVGINFNQSKKKNAYGNLFSK